MSIREVNERSWKKCSVCPQAVAFKTPADYLCHLRESHCVQEGGSFVCKYGYNGVCTTLPGIGVSDEDYENHIVKHHAFQHDDFKKASGANKFSPCGTDRPNVVSDQGRWTVYNATQNLPAVLNDPSRGKQRDFFTKTWGDTFTEKTVVSRSPYIPDITRVHFEAYLKRTSKRYRRHMKQSNSFLKSSKEDEKFQLFPSYLASRSVDNQNELQSIPKIFSFPHFNLENPDTFNAVFQWNHLYPVKTNNKHGTKDQSSSKLLQEKLSHYLDIVEVQIAQQISLKSSAFFTVISSHDAVIEQLSQTVLAVKNLRDKIHHVDDLLVKASLRLLDMSRTRENCIDVHNKLKLMATVHQAQPTIQLLLNNSEFVGALDLIVTTREILGQELAGINCFRHLGSQLAEMEKLIDTMMKSDFVRYVTTDLNRPLTDEKMIMEEERLVAIVFGMMHQSCYIFINIFKEEAFTALNALIKQIVIEIVSENDNSEEEGTSTNLFDLVKLLSFAQWMNLLKEVFSNVCKLLRRIKALHGVINDAVDIAGGKAYGPAAILIASQNMPEATNISIAVDEDTGVTICDSDYTKVNAGLKDLFYATCDHAHDRCAKLLSSKSKDGFIEKLSSAEFIALSKEIESFITDCEQICGKKSISLRLGLQSQANKFISHFHDERKTKLSLILDNERWKQADVPSEFQELVDKISSTGELAVPKKVSDSEMIEERKPQEFLTVDGEKYAVVGTALLLLKMIVEYCQCVHDIPSVSTDLLTRLVEILKTFNSRTCQLILGAGALQLVGLKTITTKYLALASRCLQLIAYYIPTIKIHFENYLPAKHQALGKNFDQVLKDYTDHIQEIVNKLVAIIDSMIDTQLDQWEVKPPVPSPYIRAICKHIAKLHEAITGLLPENQIRDLILQINGSFKSKLKQHLVELHVTNDGGPQYGLVTSDLTFYSQNLHSLIGSGISLNMDDVWSKR